MSYVGAINSIEKSKLFTGTKEIKFGIKYKVSIKYMFFLGKNNADK